MFLCRLLVKYCTWYQNITPNATNVKLSYVKEILEYAMEADGIALIIVYRSGRYWNELKEGSMSLTAFSLGAHP